MSIPTHLTAISRKNKPSVAGKYALDTYQEPGRVLDYGSGRGHDVGHMKAVGWDAVGYDPHWEPEFPEGEFDLVLLTYVLNILPTEEERLETLKRIPLAPGGCLLVTVRAMREVRYEAKKGQWETHGDGYLTSRGTFQCGFTLASLRELLQKAGYHVNISLGRGGHVMVSTSFSHHT